MSKVQEYENMERLIRCALLVGNIDYPQLLNRKKSLKTNVLRGVVCLIAYRILLIHPTTASQMLGRTRQNIINMARKYKEYFEVGDSSTTETYYSIIETFMWL